MKAIMLMFDSLNRRMLPPYGREEVHAPNFKRLADNACTFENNYAGSLPCMPARRELHTARYSFMHRSWGPIEPYDDSVPEILSKNGIYTHLVTDHYHYWQDGGADYHTRYDTFEFVRGQEGDRWKTDIDGVYPLHDPFSHRPDENWKALRRRDDINREWIKKTGDMPLKVTMDLGLEFLEKNRDADNYFLQIECFDPHQPFMADEESRKLYPGNEDVLGADWPPTDIAEEREETIERARKEYKSCLTMCDKALGRLLDHMDSHDMWKDTMLIVNTDHGFLLGEHGWWSKNDMPLYQELVNTPLFIWDPRAGVKGERRKALTQTIDIPTTLLSFFGIEPTADMQGRDLSPVIENDEKVRDYAFFGYHSKATNVTDGKWKYMRAPSDPESRAYEYTLMPMNMNKLFSQEWLRNMSLSEPFSFTKGIPLMKMKGWGCSIVQFGTKLFNLEEDPHEGHPIDDPVEEARMMRLMIRAMHENDAPREQYERMGLPEDEADATPEYVIAQREREKSLYRPDIIEDAEWEWSAVGIWRKLLEELSPDGREKATASFRDRYQHAALIDAESVMEFSLSFFPEERKAEMAHIFRRAGRTC